MALIAVAILLPIVFFILAAVQSYRSTLRETEGRVERTARVLEEHAIKVFETHRLVIQQVEGELGHIDVSKPSDERALHDLLHRLEEELDQVATITVINADGSFVASGRIFPPDHHLSFVDRDYFQALSKPDAPSLYVSRSYTGRQSKVAVFNLVQRLTRGPDHAFAGVIAVSVDRGYFERFYEAVEPTYDHSVVLIRADGAVLARVPVTPPLEALPPSSTLLQHIARSPNGAYGAVSKIDGVDRLFAYRKVAGYPVYVRFGISTSGALAGWRQTLIAYGLVAALACLALVGTSILALRQTDRERLARRRWEETASALQAEAAARSRVESQLRQAQKMEAVGRLTGGVAHDFNNLLTAVIGSLDLLRRRPERIDPRGLDLVTNALEGATRAAALTSRLLAFSRQQPLQPRPLDANALVAGMSDLLRRTLGEIVKVETVLAKGLWATSADANQLENAVLNLAVNARDAMPEGGTLTIETANVRLDSAYAADRDDVAPGAYVMIAVSDTGCGMSPDIVANIFEPFFTTKPVGQGTGLGLSQVYGFVKQSGGHVAVYSEPGHGSTFKAYLPRLADAIVAAPEPSVEPEAPLRGAGQTILVVEDEPMVRRLGIDALEEAGYRVVAASDGPAALEIARREPGIALLFTDVVLGGAMNGRRLADAVLAERPSLPVLFTTGYTRNAIVHGGRLDEGVAFIGKPFTGAALVAKVGELLGAEAHGGLAAPAL